MRFQLLLRFPAVKNVKPFPQGRPGHLILSIERARLNLATVLTPPVLLP